MGLPAKRVRGRPRPISNHKSKQRLLNEKWLENIDKQVKESRKIDEFEDEITLP